MKIFRCLLAGLLILACGLCLSCSKKVIRTEGLSAAPSKEIAKPAEPQPQLKGEGKTETASPEKSADLEREKKIKEEALREMALREEAARKEALAREAALKKLKLESIYFDFDQGNIRDDQKETMAKNSEWLKANPKVKIRVEGNCDERGTAEYNLALGQKRADAAKKYLEGLGISGDRMQTISFGLERPLDRGHNEAAWAKNRRDDFVPVR